MVSSHAADSGAEKPSMLSTLSASIEQEWDVLPVQEIGVRAGMVVVVVVVGNDVVLLVEVVMVVVGTVVVLVEVDVEVLVVVLVVEVVDVVVVVGAPSRPVIAWGPAPDPYENILLGLSLVTYVNPK